MNARTGERERPADFDQFARVAGIVLIGLGLLFLAQHAFGLHVGRYA